MEASFTAHDTEVATLRSEGLTRALSTIEVERLFALCFALEQLNKNFADLARCAEEYVQGAGGHGGGGGGAVAPALGPGSAAGVLFHTVYLSLIVAQRLMGG